MNQLLNSALWLSAIAALCYGLGGPMMKLAAQAGATNNGLCLMYGLGAATMSLNWSGKTVFFHNPKSAIIALIMGVMFGIAFRSIARAFTLPSGQMSIVLILVSAYPLISSAIGLTYFGEASKVILPRLALGSLLIVGGLILVGTSSK